MAWKNYLQILTYRRIHEISMRVPILHLYDYVKFNQLQLPARSHHALIQTRTILHTKIFLSQPIYQGILFRSPCNLRHTISRNKPGHKIYHFMSVRSTQHHKLLHNPRILHTKIVFLPACHLHQIYRCISARST